MTLTQSATEGPGIYCTFWIAQHCFGIPSWTIREIHRAVPLTPVPGTAERICGYVNLRGQLYLVLNPDGLLLDQAPRSPRKADRDLIVFRQEIGESFAIEVDAIGDITAIGDDQYHSQISDLGPGAHAAPPGALQGLVTGHATLTDQLVTLLDPHHFPLLGLAYEPSASF